MPRIYSRTQKIYKKFLTCTQPFFDDAKNREVYDAVRRGKNTYLRVDRTESSDLDISWIKRIEECIPQLSEIVDHPRRIMQTFTEVVQIEKSKKITSESVMHLASHTQFVKSIDEEGNVTPNKILNVYNDDNIKMYENKFIATLIRRLIVFVEKRYDYILHNATMKDVSLLYYKGATQIDDNEIEVETRVRFAKPSEGDGADKIRKFLYRINEIRKYLRHFNISEFMRIMHNERDVRNPILQTNIIRKNPTYRKCYHLWLFIDKYAGAGVNIRVAETIYDLAKDEIENINKSMFVDYITLRAKDNDSVGKPKYSEYQPKILKTLDDDVYTFGSLYDGPVDYVRVDDKYREFLERPKNVPPHPTKAEQAYFKDEYQHNKEMRETSMAIDSLIKRREAEAKQYQKETAALFERLKKEKEAAERQAELDRLRAQEQRVEDARAALVASANKDFGPEPVEEEIPEEIEEEIIETVEEEIPEPIEEKVDEENYEDSEFTDDYVLPPFAEVYGKKAEQELPKEGLNPLLLDDGEDFGEIERINVDSEEENDAEEASEESTEPQVIESDIPFVDEDIDPDKINEIPAEEFEQEPMDARFPEEDELEAKMESEENDDSDKENIE